MRIPRRLRKVIGRPLSAIRDEKDIVLIPAPNIGWGNIAYYWMQAMVRTRDEGIRCRVLHAPVMDQWLEVFEPVRQLVCDRSEIRFLATREHGFYQNYARHYTEPDVDEFVSRYILPSRFGSMMQAATGAQDRVLINVRRGDYYSVPEYRGQYSFDIAEYVSVALERMESSAPVERVVVVSDDIDWCKVKLASRLAGFDVEFSDPTEGAVHNLLRLATADRLILANSTFSYWGAYIAGVRNPSAHVVAPWFHMRRFDDGKAFQLLTTWDVVETIPGGWNG